MIPTLILPEDFIILSGFIFLARKNQLIIILNLDYIIKGSDVGEYHGGFI